MFQTNIVNSLVKGLDPIHQKTVSLIPGQIFNGKILKLYPGQLASLQQGQITLTAKLEVALSAGNRYWFQVQTGEGIPTLKVIDAAGEQGKGKDGESVLRQLGIANSRINEMVVNHLAKQEIPFSKEHVFRGGEIIKQLGMANNRGLAALQFLLERSLPITATAFLGAQSIIEGRDLSSQLRELDQLLAAGAEKNPSLLKLQQTVQTILSEANIKVDQNQIVELLKVFLKAEPGSVQFSQAHNDLQKLGIVEKQTTPQQLMTHFREMVVKETEEQLRQAWPTLTKDEILSHLNKGQITELLAKVVWQKGENGERSLQQILALVAKENQLGMLQNLASEESVAKQFSRVLDRIGYNYERDLLGFLNRSENINGTVLLQLKALLIQAQQQSLPTQFKDKIDSLLNRITGQQLLSVHQEGPIAHHIVSMPLNLFGLDTDLTLQWEGKKQNNGSLNPDHCRVLFYLNLETLAETIIDVQIQNRIVSLHVINENQKPVNLIGALQPILKDALAELNYQLSSIRWTQPKSVIGNKDAQKQLARGNSFYPSPKPYQGVDIRI
ncbi:hypothetical protein RJD24_13530 [Bacillaceae bacterium IKA-2]|nr:hypothetical protein RJD24_13530 [Bacillaceae bacterium IKA-2]